MDHRYDFVLLFDVADGNPTATPTPETYHALIRKLDTDLSPMYA